MIFYLSKIDTTDEDKNIDFVNKSSGNIFWAL